ncbi:hypothetical protein MLD38_023756 [Melastoma candidum]|uniref:Uncharacterized protein n=1 Tax=Melastoma candidum TaxID=119954 RepID=A0ACB9NWU6_9MYRT|nr:hypothetical protein MLD38_023756 [Melastoma candidum]
MKIGKSFLCCLLFTFHRFFLASLVLGKRRTGQEEFLHDLFTAKFTDRVDTDLVEGQLDDLEDLESVQANVYSHTGLKEADRILKFPRQPIVEFSQFGGYITVSQFAGRAFYYYFVEATKNKESLPLLRWLNGGPGCSSLAYGAMQELGPFRVYSDGKTLFRNPYSWNNAANVLFLEFPAGVGFSYSNTTSDYNNNGDKRTAMDNYVFLLNWLERFPEYKDRDFYISGESYAGHYVPQLAHLIVHYNKKAGKTIINLKGVIMGNAAINVETDERGRFKYYASHALIPSHTNDKIQRLCHLTFYAAAWSAKCKSAMTEAFNDYGYLDIYSIYAPLCMDGNITARQKAASVPKLLDLVSIYLISILILIAFAGLAMQVKNVDPCISYYMYAYMNLPDVQTAIHANVTNIKLFDWEPCSDVIQNWGDAPTTTIPILRKLMDGGVCVWMFSGDTDGRVPFVSTLDSLGTMKMPIKDRWRPWFHKGEVGGYIQVFEGDLTFVTVRGAGHMVPSDQPSRALSLISHFLTRTLLPDKP